MSVFDSDKFTESSIANKREGTSPTVSILKSRKTLTFKLRVVALERAATYRDKKIKPLFIQIKNKIAAMAVQVKELTQDVGNWKRK